MGVFLPSDTWPEHSKTWFKDVLKKARAHGWSLESHSNHSTFTVYCPRPPGDGERCELLIYSTGKGGDDVAQTHLRDIERCMHGTGAVDDLTKAAELLDRAERLLDAVECLLELADGEARALDLIDSDETTASELLRHAEALATRAEELLGPDSASIEPSQTVEEVSQVLARARGLLINLPTSNATVKHQRSRLKSLRVRHADLRKFLASS